jgi:hypothetical protein
MGKMRIQKPKTTLGRDLCMSEEEYANLQHSIDRFITYTNLHLLDSRRVNDRHIKTKHFNECIARVKDLIPDGVPYEWCEIALTTVITEELRKHRRRKAPSKNETTYREEPKIARFKRTPTEKNALRTSGSMEIPMRSHPSHPAKPRHEQPMTVQHIETRPTTRHKDKPSLFSNHDSRDSSSEVEIIEERLAVIPVADLVLATTGRLENYGTVVGPFPVSARLLTDSNTPYLFKMEKLLDEVRPPLQKLIDENLDIGASVYVEDMIAFGDGALSIALEIIAENGGRTGNIVVVFRVHYRIRSSP